MSEELKKCTKEKHISTVNGYCRSCKHIVCKDCTQSLHFDHLESITFMRDGVISLLNYLTSLKAKTSTFTSCHDLHIRNLKVEDLIEERRDIIRKEYNKLFNEVKEQIKLTTQKVRLSKYVKKIRGLLAKLKESQNSLIQLLINHRTMIQTLLNAIHESNCSLDLIKLAGEKELEKQYKEIDLIKEFEANLDLYAACLKDLSRILCTYTQEGTKIRDICRLEGQEISSERVILYMRNKKELWWYDPYTNTTECFTLTPQYIFPFYFCIVNIDSNLYIIGGNTTDFRGVVTYLKDFTQISLKSGTWARLTPLKIERRRAAASSIQNRWIYIMGGDSNGKFLNLCEKYDLQTKQWIECPSLTQYKTCVSSGVFKGTIIYIFTGYNDKDLSTIERFDTTQGLKWEVVKLKDRDKLGQAMGVIEVSDSELLLFGGNGDGLRNGTYLFDVDKGELKKFEYLREAECFLQFEPQRVGVNIYSLGFHSNALHCFNLRTKSWSVIKETEWNKNTQ